MSDTTTAPEKRIINATAIVDKLEFTEGISKKSGNQYFIGALHIKSPISDTPIRLGFEYIDPNTTALVKLAIDKMNKADEKEFQDGIK